MNSGRCGWTHSLVGRSRVSNGIPCSDSRPGYWPVGSGTRKGCQSGFDSRSSRYQSLPHLKGSSSVAEQQPYKLLVAGSSPAFPTNAGDPGSAEAHNLSLVGSTPTPATIQSVVQPGRMVVSKTTDSGSNPGTLAKSLLAHHGN